MTWTHSIGIFEFTSILLFLLFYFIYISKVLRINKFLKSSSKQFLWKFLLRLSYFSLFLIALLGPSFGEAKKEIKSMGKDIFICVDLSQSMNAFDIQPSRIERVKFELKNIIEAFNSDRKGLIMFSNEAFMQCPLTYDNNALTLFIQTLNTSLVPNTGTDFAPPLKLALNKLNSEKNTSIRQKSKVIILISDGEDFGEETEAIGEEIQKANIKLFTLGVGTEMGSKIKTRRGFKTDRDGNEVQSKLNTIALKQLAQETNGKYFEINQSRNDVNKLINTINLIEGELRDTKNIDTKSNKYFYFLILAAFLLLSDILITLKIISL
ncbi:MAG: aerotolerance regulator BatB [Flammeovirgaceae bacterium]|nr:aerotolerance regulator BatB [Flammeovirgaceae bacterium]